MMCASCFDPGRFQSPNSQSAPRWSLYGPLVNRKTVVINSALGAVLTLLGTGTFLTVTGALGGADRASSAIRTVAVARGPVAAVATASGNVSAASTTVVNAQNCTGPITAVSVALGQAVAAGQALLSIDPSNAQNALTAANAQLDSANAQANQQQVTAANQVTSASQSVSNAQQTADLDSTQQAAAVATAQKAVDTDNAAVTAAQANVTANPSSTQYQAALNAAQAQLAKDTQSLAQAQNSQASQQLKDKQQLASAQNQLSAAQNSAGGAGSTNVTSAQLAVDTATKSLANCSLTAPVAGTVTAVNAVVGGNAGSSSGSSTGSTTGAIGGSGALSGTASSTSSSSSTGLVTISDTKNLQVVANFAEADIASMKVGDTAVFTFPALKQDATASPVAGKVMAIAQNATTSNNVVSYPVTVSINNPPAELRLGQSASLSVTTATSDNALLVPTLAVTSSGNRQTVTVLKNGQPSTVAIKTGISANGRTEVLSGVGEGDQIELPAISTTVDSGTTSTGGQGTNRGGFGGAGGFGGTGGAGGGTGGGRG